MTNIAYIAAALLCASIPGYVYGQTVPGPLNVPSINSAGNAAINGALTLSSAGISVPKLDTTGIVSDDAALQAAVNACAAVGGTIYLPAGRILLNGSAGTIALKNCRIVGAGSVAGGTEIDLTSTSVIPFTVGSGWEVANVNFYWPNQTGAIVYPALFSTSTVTGAADFVLRDDSIINAYIAIDVPAGPALGRFWIIGGNWYATNTLIRVAAVVGDSDHMTSMHMSPGPWIVRCGNTTTCQGYVDAGSSNNTALHVLSGGNVQFYWDNSATYDWRYGILIDNGGTITSSHFAIAWDGTGTVLDTSNVTAGGWNGSDAIDPNGNSVCGFHYSYTSNTNDAYHPCFNTGASTVLHIGGGRWASQSDFIDMNGGEFSANGTTLSIARPSGLSSNIYAVNATGAAPAISVKDSNVQGIGASAYTNGIYASAVTGVGTYQIVNNRFSYLNQEINLPTGLPTIVTGNYASSTNGASSVSFSDFAYPIYWSNNSFDKPPLASVSSCGTGATISGAMSGVITVGTTSPTTSCKITLPFNPVGKAAGGCVFSNLATTIQAVSAGNPPQWTLTFGADSHGGTVSYDCAGNQ